MSLRRKDTQTVRARPLERIKKEALQKISKKEWPGTSPLGYLNINRDNAITGKMDINKKRQFFLKELL